MTDQNQESASAPAADQSPTSDAATAAELHDLQGKVSAIDAELTKHEQGETTGAAPKPPQAPSLGRIVIVRENGKNDAPGIIAELFEDTITCNVFRGDHIPHVATHLTQIDPKSAGSGWFWPPRV